MKIINSAGEIIAHFSDSYSVVVGAAEIYITVKPGSGNIKEVVIAHVGSKKLVVSDACGNSMISALTSGSLYLGVR